MSEDNREVSSRANVQRTTAASSRSGKAQEQSRQKFADTLRNLRRTMPSAPASTDAPADAIEADAIGALEPLRREADAADAFAREEHAQEETDRHESLTVDQHLHRGWEHLQARPTKAMSVEDQAAADNAIGYLLFKIGGFCNQSCVDESSGWQVQLPLREDVLPSTTLHLTVSPDTIDVRFHARDADSRRLISSYGDILERALKGNLKRPRDISIRID